VLWVLLPTLLILPFVGLLLLPVVFVVHAERHDESSTPDLRFRAALWWGALGVVVVQAAEGWQVRLCLLGRAVGSGWVLGGSSDPTAPDMLPPDPCPDADEAPQRSAARGTQPVTAAPPSAEPRGEPGGSSPTPDADGGDEVATDSRTYDAPVDAPPAGPAKESRATEGSSGLGALLARLQRQARLLRPLLHPLWRLIRFCPSAFDLRRIRVAGRVGLDDPAATGQVQGALQGLQAVCPDRLRVDLVADFVEPGVRGEVEARAHLHVGRLLFYVLRFAVTAGLRWLRARVALWRLERAAVAGS
jgi:hypothetical protein